MTYFLFFIFFLFFFFFFLNSYELLAIWCWQFPSQADLDNILETYLRGVPEKSIGYLGRLRDVQYGGCARTAPSVDEIDKFVFFFFLLHSSLSILRPPITYTFFLFRFVKEFFTSTPGITKSRYEENVEVIQDRVYTDEFFKFENTKTLFQFDDEDARLKVA